MSPLERYERLLSRPGFEADPAQRMAAEHLDGIYHALRAPPPKPRRWWSLGTAPVPTTPKGLYLWGSVGRGKTLLVDLFYDCLPPSSRRRQHFHSFMREVHAELKALRKVQDPPCRSCSASGR